MESQDVLCDQVRLKGVPPSRAESLSELPHQVGPTGYAPWLSGVAGGVAPWLGWAIGMFSSWAVL